MNIYRMIGHNLGTVEAQELGDRLSAWHDAMVAHERLRPKACVDDCPHAEAGLLWREAVRVFGHYSADLKFLRARGMDALEYSGRRRSWPSRLASNSPS